MLVGFFPLSLMQINVIYNLIEKETRGVIFVIQVSVSDKKWFESFSYRFGAQ
jgi:hypothetical protein